MPKSVGAMLKTSLLLAFCPLQDNKTTGFAGMFSCYSLTNLMKRE